MTAKLVEVTDVLALSPPSGVDPYDPQFRATVETMARLFVYAQWPDGQAPAITFQAMQHHVTADPDQVDVLQPAGHCDRCREGNQLTKQYLSGNPDRVAVLVTIHYVEEWPT